MLYPGVREVADRFHFSEGRPAVEAAFAAAPAPVRESLRWLTPGTATSVTV